MDANELKTSQKSQPGVISTEKSTLLAFLHKAIDAQDMKISSIAQHMYGVGTYPGDKPPQRSLFSTGGDKLPQRSLVDNRGCARIHYSESRAAVASQ